MNLLLTHRRISRIILRAGAVVFVATVLLTGCAGQMGCYNDSWIGPDKALHFAASSFIGAGVTVAARNNGISLNDAPVFGMSAVVLVGAGKETYDAGVKGTCWSVKDFTWDLLGGASGCMLVR